MKKKILTLCGLFLIGMYAVSLGTACPSCPVEEQETAEVAYPAETFGETPSEGNEPSEEVASVAASTLPLNVELTYTDKSKGKTTLGALMEKENANAILLDFWAPWCGPCKTLLPQLEQKAAKLSKQKIAVVAINIDPKQEKQAESFFKRNNIKVTSLTDSENKAYNKLLNVTGIPSNVLVSKKGEVLFHGNLLSSTDERRLDSVIAGISTAL